MDEMSEVEYEEEGKGCKGERHFGRWGREGMGYGR